MVHKSKNNLCKNFSSRNIFINLKSNMFYTFIDHTFITRHFQVFHVFEDCWRKISPKSNYSRFTMTERLGVKRGFLSTLVHEIPVGPFWPIFGLMTSPWESKLQNFEFVVSKTNTSPQISLKYWLSSFYHHWYIKTSLGPFLTQFWVNDVKKEIIFQNSEKLTRELDLIS